jgi:hypothetical protein
VRHCAAAWGQREDGKVDARTRPARGKTGAARGHAFEPTVRFCQRLIEYVEQARRCSLRYSSRASSDFGVGDGSTIECVRDAR